MDSLELQSIAKPKRKWMPGIVDYRLHMKSFISIYRAGETKTGACVLDTIEDFLIA